MSETTTGHAEHAQSPEVLAPTTRLDGAQLRFVLGNTYLNPTEEIPDKVNPNDISDIDNRDYSAFQNASTHNRIEETKRLISEHKMPVEASEQKQQWIRDTATVLTSKAHEEKITKLSPVFKQLGIDEISTESVQSLYEQLFENKSLQKYQSDGKIYYSTDVRRFVKAVIDSHTQNGTVSIEDLNNNIAEYKWFSRIFGNEMQDAIVQMIHAEARIQNNKDTFIAETMVPVNDKPRAAKDNLKADEIRILKYLKDHGVLPPDHGHDEHPNDHHDDHEKKSHDGHNQQASTETHGEKTKSETKDQPSLEEKKRILAEVAIGKTTTQPPTKVLPSEILGFQKSIETHESQSLYSKMWNDPNLPKLLEIDELLNTAIETREGRISNVISEHTVEEFKIQLQKVKQTLNTLPADKQRQLIPYIFGVIANGTEKSTEDWAKYGKSIGLDTIEKQRKYFQQSQKIAEDIFPEVTTIFKSYNKAHLLLTDEQRQFIGTENKKLVDSTKEERVANLPKRIAENAAYFADTIRIQLLIYGIQSPDPTATSEDGTKLYSFILPNSGLRILAPNRDAIGESSYNTGNFLEWADTFNIPLAFYHTPDNEGVLLKGPYQENNGWFIKVFDPLKGEQKIELKPKQSLEEYQTEQQHHYKQFYNEQEKVYVLPATDGKKETRKSESRLQNEIYWEWFRSSLPQGHDAESSIIANELLQAGQFDISIPDGDELPHPLITNKTEKMQFDKKNAIPLSFYAGMQYLSMAPSFSIERRMATTDIFTKRFESPIFIREHILQKAKSKEPEQH